VSLIRRALEQRATSFDIPDDAAVWSRRRGMFTSSAGQIVTASTADQLMANWRCKHLLADLVAGLPVDEFETTGGGKDRIRVEVEPRDAFVDSPSSFLDSNEWRYQLMLSALECGNAIAYVTQYDRAFRHAVKAEVLDPADVTVDRKGGALAPATYKVNGRVVDAGRILHLRAFGPAPGSVLGMSPLEYARTTLGLGLAVRRHGANWYARGGKPPALLSTDQAIDKTDADTARERFKAAVAEDDIAVVGKGWTYTATNLSPESALFLAATNATSVEICGYYGVPPELVGYAVGGSSVTYANREQRMLDFLTTTLQWWVGRVERLMSSQLPDGRFVKLNIDALLRSDLMTRYKSYDLGVRGGWLEQNDPRRREDMTPIPDGNRAIWPPYSTTPMPDDADDGRKP
jgi:HK97 family phage portal protein